MMSTKRRLRPWVYFALGMMVAILMMVAVKVIVSSYDKMYQACDEAKGYTCSYYEARNFLIHGE